MKTNILINNCIAFNKHIGSIYSRLDSLSILSRKSVLAILVACLTVFGVGNAWGTDYSMTMDQNASGNNNVHITETTSPVNKTYGGVTWSIAWTGTGNPTSGNKSQVQFGTATYPCTSVTLSTSGISGTITSVALTCYGANDNGSTVSVQVGSSDFTSGGNTSVALGTGSATAKTFTGSASGTITITVSQPNTSKAIYISAVSVTYTACSNSMTISKGTGTNCTFTLGTSGSGIASCSGVSTTVSITPNTGYGTPVVTESLGSATITGTGNSRTVTYAANTTGTSTIAVSCSANTYTVTLNDNTGSGGSGSKTVTYNASTNLTTSVAVPTKAHHDFAGYWTSTDNGATFGTKLVNADGSWVASVTNYTDASKNWIKADDVTLYAKWTEHGMTNYRTVCSSTYNVTYEGNGNTDGSVPTDNTDYDSGDEVTVLGNSGSLVKTHYAFDGWNTKADGSGDPYAEDETFEITKNTTLYAQWACDENITISAGTPTNGSFTLSSTGDVETCSDDVVITVTPSPNTGYNFSAITQTGLNSGVTINQSDKTVTYDQYSSGTTTINVTFVAKTTTVTLNKNGATSGTNQTVSATYGLAMPTTTTASVDLEAPSKNGYTLLGFWDTSETTGGKQYYDANMTSVTSWDKEDATVTLYARWEAKVDRFIDDMHETSGYTSAAPHEESGASYTMPGPLSNTTPGGDCVTAHYIFVGWVLSTGQNSNGTLKDSGSRIYRPGETKDATNATYYAVWAEE